MQNWSNSIVADKGLIFFAWNNDQVDYQLLVTANAVRIKQFSDISISVITDRAWSCNYIDNFIIADPGQPTVRRDQIQVTDQWMNRNRHQAYELSPYEQTLILDADYFLASDQLLKIFDTDYDFAIAHKFWDLITGVQQERKLISEFGLANVYATATYFKKSLISDLIFQRVQTVKNNWDYYQTLYQFISKFRNDYAFAIALHEINNGLVDRTMLLDHIIWNAMPAAEFTVTENRPCIRQADIEIDINNIDLHMLNKKSATAYANWIINEL